MITLEQRAQLMAVVIKEMQPHAQGMAELFTAAGLHPTEALAIASRAVNEELLEKDAFTAGVIMGVCFWQATAAPDFAEKLKRMGIRSAQVQAAKARQN